MSNEMMREIMADVRADRWSNLWERYGKWVIYSALSVVILTAVSVYSNHYKKTEAMKATQHYFESGLLIEQEDNAGALSKLETISVSKQSEIYSLVLLKKIELLRALKRDKEANDAIALLVKNEGVFADMGALLQDGEVLDATDSKPSPLRFSKQEWAAWRHIEQGQKSEAAKLFATLAESKTAPQTLYNRARMMSDYLEARHE